MHKTALFSIKNCKNRPALFAQRIAKIAQRQNSEATYPMSHKEATGGYYNRHHLTTSSDY